MPQSQDLKLKGRSGPKRCQQGCRECGQYQSGRESTEEGQRPLYRPDRSFANHTVADGRIRLTRPDGIIVEHHNGCVHVEIDGGLLDFKAFEIA